MDSPDSVDRGSPDSDWEYNQGSDLEDSYWEEDSVWKDSPGSDWTDMPCNLWNDNLDYVSKDVNRTVWKDSPGRVTENMPRNVWKDSPRDITKDLPGTVWKDSPGSVTEDLPDNVWKDSPVGVTEDLPDNVWKDSPSGITEDIPASVWKDSTGGDWKVPMNVIARVPSRVYKELSRKLFNDSPYCVLKYSHFSFRRDLPGSFRRGSSASLGKDPVPGHSGYRKTTSPTPGKKRSSGMIRVSSAGNIRKEDHSIGKKDYIRNRKKSGSTDRKDSTRQWKGSADSVLKDTSDCERKVLTGSLKNLPLAAGSKSSLDSLEIESPGKKVSIGSIENDLPVSIKKDLDDSHRKVSISSDPGPSDVVEKNLKNPTRKDSKDPVEHSHLKSKVAPEAAKETDSHKTILQKVDKGSKRRSKTQSSANKVADDMTSKNNFKQP